MRLLDAIAAAHTVAATMIDRPLMSERMKTPKVHGDDEPAMQPYVPK
jgi:hypothetical protein